MAAAKRKSGGRKYGESASKHVKSAMRKRKKGTLESGSGRKVRSRKQAIAIGLSEARSKGAKVPRKKSSSKRKSSAKRKTAASKPASGRKSSSRKRSATRRK